MTENGVRGGVVGKEMGVAPKWAARGTLVVFAICTLIS